MTANDDWQKFVGMMEAANYGYHPNTPNIFTHRETSAQYNSATGKFRLSAGKASWIGDWRQWLEAGQTPAPW